MDFFEIELLCLFLEQVSEEAIFKYYKMIICNVQGGFGNHLLCVCLGIILENKYNINIKIVFIYANGFNTNIPIIFDDTMDEKYLKCANLTATKLNKVCTTYHCAVNKYVVTWFQGKKYSLIM